MMFHIKIEIVLRFEYSHDLRPKKTRLLAEKWLCFTLTIFY